jgi:hypothetical protein
VRILLVGLALSVFSYEASADALQELFGTGVLGLEWRATVQKVTQKFPDGSMFPLSLYDQGRVGYRVTSDIEVLGLKSTDQEVKFSFDVQDRLRTVGFYFDFSRSEIVLRYVTEALGKHTRMNSNFRTTTYYWLPATKEAAPNSPFAPAVALTIGNALPYEWVVLYISDESESLRDR